MPTGGDIVEVTYNHPTLGGGVIFAKAAEDSTFNLGGIRTNDDMNGIDGGGRSIRILSRQRWAVDLVVAWDMNVNLTLEAVTALAGSPLEAQFTISHINGSIYSGTGTAVGDVAGNGNAATFPLKLSGGGILKKQA